MKARKSKLKKLEPLKKMPFSNLADLIKTEEVVDEDGNRIQLFENHKAPQSYKYGIRIVPKGHKTGKFIYGRLPELQDMLVRAQQKGITGGLKDLVTPSMDSDYFYLDKPPEPFKPVNESKASRLYKQDIDTVFEKGVLTEHEKELVEKALLARQEKAAQAQSPEPAQPRQEANLI